MMRRIIFLVLIILLLVRCGMKEDQNPNQNIVDSLNEPIDFSNVKQLDLDKMITKMEEERTKVYLPDLDQMYRSVRTYNYDIQHERAWIRSEYEFDEQKDHHYYSTTVEASYAKEEKRPFTDRGKEYMWHLIKKIANKSTRINQDGFKGYDTLYGAKLDDRRFYLEKDGYVYYFSPLMRNPEGFKDFDYVQHTLNSLRKAVDFDEWEEMKAGILTKVLLPDVSAYRPKLLSFMHHASDVNKDELVYRFDNDETSFEFGAYEDGIDFDMHSFAVGIDLRDIHEDVSTRTLSNGLQLSRHVFSRNRLYSPYDFKWIIYTWEMDELHYYIAVKDERVEKLDDLEEYEAEYMQLIESLEKPSE